MVKKVRLVLLAILLVSLGGSVPPEVDATVSHSCYDGFSCWQCVAVPFGTSHCDPSWRRSHCFCDDIGGGCIAWQTCGYTGLP